MLKIWPSDTAIQNDEAYIHLLLLTGETTSVRAVGSTRRGVVPSGTESQPEAMSSQSSASRPPLSASPLRAVGSSLRAGGSAPEAEPEANSNRSSSSDAEEVDAIVKLAEKLVRDEPASLPHRTLLALALLKQNRAQDALAVYANLKVPSNAVSASAVAVHASVLASTGRRDEARAEIAKVPSNRLLPEEAMMVLPLRG